MGKEINHTMPGYLELGKFYEANRTGIIRMLLSRYSPALNEMDCEDIYSDAFIILYEKIAKEDFTLTSSLKSFFMGICNNQALKKLEKKGKTSELPQTKDKETKQPIVDEGKLHELLSFHERMDNDGNICDLEECYSAISNALASMKDKCKQIMLSTYYDNLSYNEIAEMMGYGSARSVNTTAARCREEFKSKNKQYLLEICR